MPIPGSLLVVALGLGLAACAAARPAPVAGASAGTAAPGCPSVVGPRTKLAETDRLASTQSRGKGNEAFLSFAADDFVLLAPGENPIVGVQAARAFFQRADPKGEVAFGWEPVRIDVSDDGKLGVSFGWLNATLPDASGEKTTMHGKVLNVWRAEGGRWRLAVQARTGFRAIALAAPPPSYPLYPDDGHRRCPATVDVAAERQAILDTDAAFAARSMTAGRATAFHDYAADDAVALPLVQIVYGRQAILDFFTAQTGPGETLDWKPLRGDVAHSGDLGYTIGEAVFTGTGPSGPQTAYMKYLTIWEKQDGGAWRFIADGGSSRPPPP